MIWGEKNKTKQNKAETCHLFVRVAAVCLAHFYLSSSKSRQLLSFKKVYSPPNLQFSSMSVADDWVNENKSHSKLYLTFKSCLQLAVVETNQALNLGREFLCE